VFEQYGLPESILCDHGTPWWCSSNGHGLTTLSVGLIKQGINLIYSGFAHPPDWIYPENSDVKKLDSGGFLYLNRRRHFVSEALRNERVWCQRFGDRILVTYQHMHVREIDLQTAKSVAVVRPYSPKEFS
jgi:hypothetical protein